LWPLVVEEGTGAAIGDFGGMASPGGRIHYPGLAKFWR
jgi:hypothetical protein